MDNKLSVTISDHERMRREFQKEIDRQNGVITDALRLVDKMATNNAKWGENLLKVTKEFHEFKRNVICACVCFIVGAFVSAILNSSHFVR